MLGFLAVWFRRRWGQAVVIPAVKPPSPTRLAFDLTNTLLDTVGYQPTQLSFSAVNTGLAFLGDDGFAMSTPLIFTQTETGPITVALTGIDGTAEDLSTASSVTFKMIANDGTTKVNSVALTSPTSAGTAVWTRLAADTDTAGDFIAQVTVIRSDATLGKYPDATYGVPITILKAV